MEILESFVKLLGRYCTSLSTGNYIIIMSYMKGAGGLKTLLTGTPRYQIVLLVDAGDTVLKI